MHVRMPAALLLLLYTAALGVAAADLRSRGLAGAVVLAALLARWVPRIRGAATRAARAVPASPPNGNPARDGLARGLAGHPAIAPLDE